MTGEAIVSLIVAIPVLVVMLWLAVNILPRALTVAIEMQEWAWELGVIGRAVFIACWLFMFPFMSTVCLVGGALRWYAERDLERRKERGEDA